MYKNNFTLNKQLRHQHAFTLLEILVTLTIIAILSAVAIPSYTNYIEKAKTSELLTIANTQKLKALELFSANQGANNINCKNYNATAATPLTKYIENIIAWKENDQYLFQIKGAKTAFTENSNKDLILEFKGTEREGFITWECFVQNEFASKFPNTCQGMDISTHNC